MTYQPHMPWMHREPIAKLSDADNQEIIRLSRQLLSLTGTLRTQFLNAIAKLSAQIDGPRLIALLQAGHIDAALRIVSDQALAAGMQPIANSFSSAVITAGESAAAVIPAEQIFSFGVTNPATVRYLQSYEFGLIRDLTNSARDAIRTTITAGVQAGLGPPTIARDVKGSIGLTPNQAQAVANYRRALENGEGSALTRALRDRRFDSSVAAAARGDRALTQPQIDNMVSAYQHRYLQYRANTIARTETAAAQSFGNHEAWRQAVAAKQIDEDFIIRRWHYTHDEKTRHSHRTIMDRNPDGVGLNEPFASELGDIMYPGDPDAAAANSINCRCAVFLRYRPKSK